MATLKFDGKDIAPLLGLGEKKPGQFDDVKPMGPDSGDAPPMQYGGQPAPPTPQPLPAQAGFTAWANDPLTQKKIADGITAPGQPLVPPSAMASVAPVGAGAAGAGPADPMAGIQRMPGVSAPAPQAGAVPAMDTSKLQADQAELARLQKTGSGVSQIKNPWLRTIARIGDAAGTILAPGVASAIPGTTVHNWTLQNLKQGQIAGDKNDLSNIAKLQDSQSLVTQRNAAANKSDATSDLMTPFTMTAEQAKAINQPSLAGTQTTMRDYNKALVGAGNNNTSSENNQRSTATSTANAQQNNQTRREIAGQRDETQRAISDAANKTKMLVGQMHDATSRANNANTVAGRGTSADGGYKVPADVTKRAALASNVLENADGVDQILSKRPEIVGSMGGRYSNVQQMIGSDDPEIQALGVRIHNIALAGNGAHGVRSNGAVQKTEDELFNHFKTGPNGIKAALGATRDSMQTFLQDEQNFSTTGSRRGNAGGGAGGPAAGAPAEQLPAAAAAQLSEGKNHTFNNGQTWTKSNGKPVRVK